MAGLGYIGSTVQQQQPPPPPTDMAPLTSRVFQSNPHVENLSAGMFLELCKQHKIDTSYVQLRIPPGFIPPPMIAKPLPHDDETIFNHYRHAIEAMKNGEPVVDGSCRLLHRSSSRDRDSRDSRDSRDRSSSSSRRRDRSPDSRRSRSPPSSRRDRSRSRSRSRSPPKRRRSRSRTPPRSHYGRR